MYFLINATQKPLKWFIKICWTHLILCHFYSITNQKSFTNWSFKSSPKNDYITTPICLVTWSPVFGLHIPFSPNISTIEMKHCSKVIPPPKHLPNQGNWKASFLYSHITQIGGFTLYRWALEVNITGAPAGTRRGLASCLPDHWGLLTVHLSSPLRSLVWRWRRPNSWCFHPGRHRPSSLEYPVQRPGKQTTKTTTRSFLLALDAPHALQSILLSPTHHVKPNWGLLYFPPPVQTRILGSMSLIFKNC